MHNLVDAGWLLGHGAPPRGRWSRCVTANLPLVNLTDRTTDIYAEDRYILTLPPLFVPETAAPPWKSGGGAVTFGVERGPDWAILRLSGDIDSLWSKAQQESISKFFDDCPRLVVVDLEPVMFMDSSGLGLLARCVKTCNDNQGVVVAAGPNKTVRKAIDIVGLHQFMAIVDTSAEQVIRDAPAINDVL
jgi:anti-anti-sigma factor